MGAFMQALGYEFRADPVGDADGLLFKRALRLTHPDNVRWSPSNMQHSMTCQCVNPPAVVWCCTLGCAGAVERLASQWRLLRLCITRQMPQNMDMQCPHGFVTVRMGPSRVAH